MKQRINIFWFRRDLRIDDNAGLFHALQSELPILPIFIFDRNILDDLSDRRDKRVNFIYHAITQLRDELNALESTIDVRHGFPLEIFSELIAKYDIDTVFTNHDYEPYAIERDKLVGDFLASKGINFKTFKDQVIFEKLEVAKDDDSPYTVFTPYSKRWKAVLGDFPVQSYNTKKFFDRFVRNLTTALPSLQSMGFERCSSKFPDLSPDSALIKSYKDSRDIPGIEGTSRLGVHLRFGTISIRKLVALAMTLSETFLNELIWREFYQMILWNFPHVGLGHAFKKEYDKIIWRNNEQEFERWCEGKTGYPIVDAGMRELNATGFMHNRVRMIVASFLSKDLLIDWRWGEAYFAEKLLDFEFASNNGGWQWAAGTGCDAAPYFRIFNPYAQTKKFDPELKYIRKWVPELEEFTYPSPIVDHNFARQRCLQAYKKALQSY